MTIFGISFLILSRSSGSTKTSLSPHTRATWSKVISLKKNKNFWNQMLWNDFPNTPNVSKLPLPWHFSDCMMVATETHGVEGSSLQSPSRNHRTFLKGKNVILYISRWTFRSQRPQRDTCGPNTNTNKNHKPGNIVPPRGADCASLPMRNSALNSFVFCLFIVMHHHQWWWC